MNKKDVYIEYYKNEKLDKNAFLLEAGQGKNINGNIYAFLYELSNNKKWKNFHSYIVVVNETIDAAKKRAEFYGFKNVHFVIRNSSKYKKLLATCKYLITDNSFPPYYIKKKGQIMLNTWHGTPLKTLGRCDIINSSSISNVQKNYAMSDYVLFPNKYTRDIFMEDYCLKNILTNKILLADYPRNVAFYNEELKNEIKDKYDLHDKEIFAYMPTWRGSSRNANVTLQKKITIDYLEEIDSKLKENQILYVNLHFLIGNDIDLSSMKHIRMFPKEYETYDFLNVCDILISDYSSVFFDFAVTKKKIVLFTYDLEEYISSRGMYFPIENLPFPRAASVDELIEELNSNDHQTYDEFYNEYCHYTSQSIVTDILELLTTGKSNKICIEDIPYNGKENVFIHVDMIQNKHQEKVVLNYINQLNEDKNYVILFHGKINESMISFIQQIPKNIQIFGYVTKNEFDFKEKFVLTLGTKFPFLNSLFNNIEKSALKRECFRRFGHLKIDRIINLFDAKMYLSRSLSFISCPKTFVTLPNAYLGLKNTKSWAKFNYRYQRKHYDSHIIVKDEICDEETSSSFYNLSVSFSRLLSKMKKDDNHIIYSMYFFTKTNIDFSFKEVDVYIGDKKVISHFKYSKGIKFGKYVFLNKVTISIDKNDVLGFPIQNKVTFIYEKDKKGFNKGIRYSFINKKDKFSNSKIIELNNETSCYFRKSKNNTLFLTVRPGNVTDKKLEDIKLNIAYYLSKLLKKKKIYLLFEKDSSRYEESASVVYEKMIDQGYKNAYFILDKHYPDASKIKKKYKKNIINKYSFKHYLYFFMCDTFLGSEALIHVLELRCKNEKVLQKVASKYNNYVFLQHGVMYMISLDSESRTFFKPRSINEPGKYRVVTSSVNEAKHFIELGEHDSTQVVICGLPKFDKNIWYDSADKIVVMPTWRPWEYNEAMTDFKASKYYKMLVRIYEAIDEKYRDRLIILPHPLFYKAAEHNDFELKKYMKFNVKYDEILRNTKILITDYSSIAYDAFYRGCNVIFYWEELEECLENYGPSTKLMLNHDNCYGDICMNAEELSKVIDTNYENDQRQDYIENYHKIVEFTDGHNTDRLLEVLKKDKII